MMLLPLGSDKCVLSAGEVPAIAGEVPAREAAAGKGQQPNYSLHYINGCNWRQDRQDRGLAWILQNRMQWQQWQQRRQPVGDVAATLPGGPDICVVIRYTTAPTKEVSANRTRLQPNII